GRPERAVEVDVEFRLGQAGEELTRRHRAPGRGGRRCGGSPRPRAGRPGPPGARGRRSGTPCRRPAAPPARGRGRARRRARGRRPGASPAVHSRRRGWIRARTQYPPAPRRRASAALAPPPGTGIFVCPHMADRLTTTDLLLTLAQGPRPRSVHGGAAAPLFGSDPPALAGRPQPTGSRRLRVLRALGVVRDPPLAQFVACRLERSGARRARLLALLLEAV